MYCIGVENWYVLCQDRERWSSMCAIAVDEIAQCREGNTCAANRASQEKKKLNVIVEEISEDRGFNQTSLFL